MTMMPTLLLLVFLTVACQSIGVQGMGCDPGLKRSVRYEKRCPNSVHEHAHAHDDHPVEGNKPMCEVWPVQQCVADTRKKPNRVDFNAVDNFKPDTAFKPASPVSSNFKGNNAFHQQQRPQPVNQQPKQPVRAIVKQPVRTVVKQPVHNTVASTGNALFSDQATSVYGDQDQPSYQEQQPSYESQDGYDGDVKPQESKFFVQRPLDNSEKIVYATVDSGSSSIKYPSDDQYSNSQFSKPTVSFSAGQYSDDQYSQGQFPSSSSSIQYSDDQYSSQDQFSSSSDRYSGGQISDSQYSTGGSGGYDSEFIRIL